MDRSEARRRIRELDEALAEEPMDLNTVNSPETARSSASGLARIPFLRIDDIVRLRAQGITTIEELEDSVLEVPETTWPQILDLARTRVLEVDTSEMSLPEGPEENGEGELSRCMALTREGRQCRNKSREGSKYCGAHKGYQPTAEELEARQEGKIEA